MKPVRSPKYFRWIRTLPCSVCHTTRAVEAAHTGPHGLSQKSSDLSAIPLCAKHHRTGDKSYHKLGARKFSEVHHLDVLAVVARLSAKPFVRVVSGIFVDRLEDQDYELGSTEAGLARAIRRMSEFQRAPRLTWSRVEARQVGEIRHPGAGATGSSTLYKHPLLADPENSLSIPPNTTSMLPRHHRQEDGQVAPERSSLLASTIRKP